jgi:hypothetical protein
MSFILGIQRLIENKGKSNSCSLHNKARFQKKRKTNTRTNIHTKPANKKQKIRKSDLTTQ